MNARIENMSPHERTLLEAARAQARDRSQREVATMIVYMGYEVRGGAQECSVYAYVRSAGESAPEHWFYREEVTPAMPMPGCYRLTRDGKEVLTGTETECWDYIHRTRSCSVAWACKYEGYRIERVEGGE